MIRTSTRGRDTLVRDVVDGKEITRLIIHRREMRVGSAVVRIGGIGNVVTKPSFRRHGHARELLSESIRLMGSMGFDVSILFGIPYFYDRFGYTSVIGDYRIEIPTGGGEQAMTYCEVLSMSPDDVPAIIGMYNSDNSRRTGSLVRQLSTWTVFRLGSDWDIPSAAVVAKSGGKVVGYAAYDDVPDHVNVTEVVGAGGDVYSTFIKYFADMAVRRRAASVAFLAPPDHAFAGFARRYGCTSHIAFPNCRDGMGRIINLRATFEKLLPELNARLAGAGRLPLPAMSGVLRISTDIGDLDLLVDGANLQLGPAPVDALHADWELKIDQGQLLALVMGFRSVDDVLHEARIRLAGAGTGGQGEALLNAIFPMGYPHLHPSDRF
ncbi:MAG: GNAT family N-acetyltransferase [Clostridia bacterium]|nr:GNAT family N-acetyltransferase [Clostridia bacterium]